MTRFTCFRGLHTVWPIVAALALSGAPGVNAQSPVFKSGIDIVPLTVTVTDRAGKYVTGLTSSNFRVFEDGVLQPLSFFANDNVPVDLVLVIDISSSMQEDLPLLHSAASGLVRQLRSHDRVGVIQVNEIAAINQPLTTDYASVLAAIRKMSVSGSTALYDGLYAVLKELAHQREGLNAVRRQAVVLLSDGLDNKSLLSFDDVVDVARAGAVSIYPIALRGDASLVSRSALSQRDLDVEYTMSTVARESGGRAFFPKAARELPLICKAIAQEVSNQYELAYMPTRPTGDGSFRRVAVRIEPATSASVRTRTGYYPSRITSTVRLGLRRP
jgi:Ca-activated chloride channel family protein